MMVVMPPRTVIVRSGSWQFRTCRRAHEPFDVAPRPDLPRRRRVLPIGDKFRVVRNGDVPRDRRSHRLLGGDRHHHRRSSGRLRGEGGVPVWMEHGRDEHEAPIVRGFVDDPLDQPFPQIVGTSDAAVLDDDPAAISGPVEDQWPDRRCRGTAGHPRCVRVAAVLGIDPGLLLGEADAARRCEAERHRQDAVAGSDDAIRVRHQSAHADCDGPSPVR